MINSSVLSRIEPCILSISMDEYNARPEFRSSYFKWLKRSPLHFITNYAQPPESTAAQDLGTLIHAAGLEGEAFFKNLAVLPEGMIRNAKHAAYKEFLAESQGRHVIKKDQLDVVERAVNALYANREASELLQGGKAEQSIFWTELTSGVACKARPDYLLPEGVDVSLKTAADASEYKFGKEAIYKYNYHLQAAFYQLAIETALGIPRADTKLIVIETTPPYAVVMPDIPRKLVDGARSECQRLLEIYAECVRKDQWPGYTPYSLPVPEWMK